MTLADCKMVPVPVDLTAVGVGVRLNPACHVLGWAMDKGSQAVCLSLWSFLSLTPVPTLLAPGALRRWQSRGDSKSRVNLGLASPLPVLSPPQSRQGPVASQTTPAPMFPFSGPLSLPAVAHGAQPSGFESWLGHSIRQARPRASSLT